MHNYLNKKYLLPLLSGILFASSFYTNYLSFVAWFCLVPLFVSMQDRSPRESFKMGLIFGISANYAGQYWLVGTLTRFGGFPLIVSILFIFILCCYLALQFSVFTYLCTKFGLLYKGTLPATVLAASIWVSLEYFFPQLFPFGIGNSQALNTTIIQFVDVLGVHFISFVIVFINLAIFRLYSVFGKPDQFPYLEVSTSVLLLLLLIVYGIYRIDLENIRITKAPKISAGIVQANFDFFEKNEQNKDMVTEKHKSMSESVSDADLIIWPETAVLSWVPLEAGYYTVNDVPVVPDMGNTLFLVGGLSFKDENDSPDRQPGPGGTKYNSAFLLDNEGKVLDRYHKIELLLFGEYLPFSRQFPSIKKLSPATGDFTPGSELDVLESKDKGLRIAPLICYEDIIPYFSRAFVQKGANLLVNITNDAWFGRSIAPYQHLLISIPRAIETRRSFIRSTNTGVSAFIDSAGRVLYRSEIFQDTAVKKEVALMDGDQTFYVKAGEIFPVLCSIISVLLIYYMHLGRKYVR